MMKIALLLGVTLAVAYAQQYAVSKNFNLLSLKGLSKTDCCAIAWHRCNCGHYNNDNYYCFCW